MSGGALWLLLLPLALALVSAASDPEVKVSWGDWIIVDDAEPGTSILLRRITPKSVFVAPTFNGCSEGYRQDSLGRCVKLVKVNQQAQWNFFLERLNSMYAPSSSSKNPQKEAGPFHINLPIGSESSQEETVKNKRLPPMMRTTSEPSTYMTTSTTLAPLPTTITVPTQTIEESTTPEALQSTIVEPPETTNTEREFTHLESTTDLRKETTEDFSDAVMLGDQPIIVEDSDEENLETPKNSKENPSQLKEKPFVIIVTNEPTPRMETTTFTSTTEGEVEGEDIGMPSTTESTTEGTTETTSKYTTEVTPRTTDYDDSFSETRDVTDSSRPAVRFVSTVRPKCDSLEVSDGSFNPSDCEPETEVISVEREVTNPSVSLPTSSMPLLEPGTQVRFPSESYVPVRKTQSYVRFPEAGDPHNDRPAFWWPTWQVRQHPGIRGWPPSDSGSSDQVIHRQYPPYTSWADSTGWRRRFLQRD